ncbi:MAG: hypothetical protein KF756_12600 [Acidobacteria bacterium]|nr:hypothetical protein [Acidobacteriota bacterium]
MTITNPSADLALNERLKDLVRRSLGIFPTDYYDKTVVDFGLSAARRNAQITEITHDIDFGPSGGVIVNVSVTLGDGAVAAKPSGILTRGGKGDFPVLYQGNGTHFRIKLEALGMLYSNNNAWYGQPDQMLAGNPLVAGETAGSGLSGWGEGFAHAGLYGITPVSKSVYAYGGLSAIVSGSAGQELFTDKTRGHLGIEDAYVGVVGGTTTDKGNRFVINASVGRKKFSISDGFLIANTAANGQDRAGLQSNPRWAADLLALVQVKYNNTLIEVFHLDPDELPVIDTKTRFYGVNVETRLRDQLNLGFTYLKVGRSNFAYYSLTDSFTRSGLNVYDGRFRWQPKPTGRSGPFLIGEAAFQSNPRFDMAAYAVQGEAGWAFAKLAWSPTVSYRYAKFSGDDPDTERFERWDPLLSGGNGEQWVQGINHFKVFQNSNLISHRFQGRLRPKPRIELVPQVWLFRAPSTLNLGGNPALSILTSKNLGVEANLTVKYFLSRNAFIQGHVAMTSPGTAVDGALGPTTSSWVSAMVFLRYAF